MTDTPTLPSRLNAIRDALAEARRYVRRDPEECGRQLEDVGDALLSLPTAMITLGMVGRDVTDAEPFVKRLWWNLKTTPQFFHVAPAASEGYIDGVSMELALWRSRLEREEGNEQ